MLLLILNSPQPSRPTRTRSSCLMRGLLSSCSQASHTTREKLVRADWSSRLPATISSRGPRRGPRLEGDARPAAAPLAFPAQHLAPQHQPQPSSLADAQRSVLRACRFHSPSWRPLWASQTAALSQNGYYCYGAEAFKKVALFRARDFEGTLLLPTGAPPLPAGPRKARGRSRP